MQDELLTQKELGALLKTGKNGVTARKFCEAHGIVPINIGNGTKCRLRWMKSDVMQMLGTLKAKAEPSKEFIPRRKSSNIVLGKSVDELMRELSVPVQ